MANGFTHIWVHGTAIQYNKNDTSGPTPYYAHLETMYNNNGFEIRRMSDNNNTRWEPMLYLPLITPSAISDALTSFQSLTLKYKTQGKACITSLRLFRNRGIEYALDGILKNLPLKGDLLKNLQHGKNYWTPLYPNNNLIANGGLCLELNLLFEPDNPDNPSYIPDSVIIAEAEIVFQHKKFDYE